MSNQRLARSICAVENKWLLAEKEPPHSIYLTDAGQGLKPHAPLRCDLMDIPPSKYLLIVTPTRANRR